MSKLTAYSAAVAGRGWAYAASLAGGIASIAANIAHSYVPPVGAAPGWQPMTGKIIESVLWPVFLFLAVELLSRVAWPRGFWYGVLRYAATLPVACVTAIVSYSHASGLLTYYGEEHIVTVVGPIGIDGLMLGATAALIVTGHRRLTMTVADAPTAIETPDAATVPATVTPEPATVPAIETPDAAPEMADAATVTPEPAFTPPARVADLYDRMAGAASSNATAPAPAVQFSEKPRPSHETRRLYMELKAQDPTITQQKAADALEISRRTLRDALDATEPDPSKRRSASETREMFLDLKAKDPRLTHAQGAEALGMNREDLRNALAATSAPTPATVTPISATVTAPELADAA